MSPNAGIVVGQQLQTHADLILQPVAAGIAHVLMSLGERACEELHMVANLVRNDVGIAKGVALDTELAFHLGEERQVDIQVLVA